MSNEKRAAFEYADNLKEPWRSDPIVRGMVEEAFVAGLSAPIKTVKPEWTGGDLRYQGTWECPNCRRRWYPSETPKVGEFCVCGSKIIE